MYGGAIWNGRIDYMLAVAVMFGKQISKEKRRVTVRVTERTVAKAIHGLWFSRPHLFH